MKLTPISSRKLERLENAVRINTPKNNQYANTTRRTRIPEYSGSRIMLERYAEVMDPQDYIRARNYLSALEMQELSKGSDLL